MNWEYLELRIYVSGDLREVREAGERGWELVSVLEYMDSRFFYFKRPYPIKALNDKP